jgi:hypothetical protein
MYAQMAIERFRRALRHRYLCAGLLLAVLGAWAVELFGWRIFGGHEARVASAVAITATFYMAWLLEQPDEPPGSSHRFEAGKHATEPGLLRRHAGRQRPVTKRRNS